MTMESNRRRITSLEEFVDVTSRHGKRGKFMFLARREDDFLHVTMPVS